MKSAFDANVPRRKPRTRLGTMLADIDAAQEQATETEVAPSEEQAAKVDADEQRAARVKDKVKKAVSKQSKAKKPRAKKAKIETAPPEAKDQVTPPETVTEPAPEIVQATATVAEEIAAPVPTPTAAAELAEQPTEAPLVQAKADLEQTLKPLTTEAPATVTPVATASTARPPDPVLKKTESAVQDSRAMIAQLRERLRRSRRQQLPIAAPQTTASRVKETVEVLQAELTKTQQEREELVRETEGLRRTLAGEQARTQQLEDELGEAQKTAQQRDQLAEAAIEESEVMAVERDEALGRLNELHEVHTERETLLSELETDLNEARRTNTELQGQLQSLKDGLHNAMTDIEVSRAELLREQKERRRQEDRVRELEDELARLQNARSALVEIQRLVDTV